MWSRLYHGDRFILKSVVNCLINNLFYHKKYDKSIFERPINSLYFITSLDMDILILNSAVTDFRRPDFVFADNLAGKDGLAKCKTENMPKFSQEKLQEWIEHGFATAGGPGNTAPLIGRAGLKVAVAANLGKGDYDGLDAQGKFFCDTMTSNGIDVSQIYIHPELPTGTTFIHSPSTEGRGGIVYFPNANDDFDFEIFKKSVKRLNPKIVYYMYSGLSDRADANNGHDLAEFIKWCRNRKIITVVDSHTLTGNPDELICQGRPVEQYRLLEPLLPELDIFFTSCDEAKLIENTLSARRKWDDFDEQENITHFLDFLTGNFWKEGKGTKLFGVTVSDGAYEKHIGPNGETGGPNRVKSRFMAGEVVDLVGAGDSFRAGLITYIASNLSLFKNGCLNFEEAVQMGNLFASLFIKAPVNDRYANIKTYDALLNVIRSGRTYPSFEVLQRELSN